MHQGVLTLRDQIVHDEKWSKEFFRAALAAEEGFRFWKELGNNYLAQCLNNAREGHLGTAVFYEQDALKKKEQIALLEKSA